MPRFKLTIEYAGTRYSGWQIQKNEKTIQGEIDRAVRTVTKRKDFELYGSGRTDAGVHALAQVAHLDLSTALTPVRMPSPGDSISTTALSVSTSRSGSPLATRSPSRFRQASSLPVSCAISRAGMTTLMAIP